MHRNGSPPTCGCRHGDGRAPLEAPLCSQSDGVARSGRQVGHDVARRRGRDLRLPDLAVLGDVHQPVGGDLGPGFPPPQGEGVLCGLRFLQVSGRIDI